MERYAHFRRAELRWSDTDLDTVADFLPARPEPVGRHAPRGARPP
ncbi:hypothetical protein ACFY04_37595 [Streptomyces sp. NPDC001549]